MNLFCYLGLHDWSKVQHRPCERYQTCTRCSKEKVFKGWHCFDKWGETYYVNVTYTYGRDTIGTHTESRKDRYCSDCQLKDVWTLE